MTSILDRLLRKVPDADKMSTMNAELDSFIQRWRNVLAKHPDLQQDPAGSLSAVAGSMLTETELSRSHAAYVVTLGALAIQRLVLAGESPDSREPLGDK